MFLPFKKKFLPRQNKGAVIQILRETNPSPRYEEIIAWLSANNPNMSIVEYTINQEPGNILWSRLAKGPKDKIIGLPQVFLVYGKTCIHIGDIEGVMIAFPAKNTLEENPEELCES